ncbi:MAG: excinuclease ABC subunit UvrC [Deltaproteobacteria bacterium]|nr:excinuclease ABC subunit UvrC [Deltaproteobacteria bacterium]
MESEKIITAPAAPGVYLMKNRDGGVIYVGKSGNLKNRVKSYFSGTDSRVMVPFLVSRVYEVDVIVTETEKEALILENSLIKEHRPRYNVIFKDDKTYFNIRINTSEPFPRFQLVRRPKQDGARYFGPYPSSSSAKETLRFIQSVFPLRTCGDQELNTRKRPCLEYEIKRCAAPCVGMIDGLSYRRLVMDGIAFLEGSARKLIADLRTRMKSVSERMCFEEAALLRDRIAAVEETLEKQRVVSMDAKDRDVFGLYREGDLTQICILYIRGGRILDKKAFPLLKAAGESSEILSSFVKQYYDSGVYIPDGVILPCEIEDGGIIKDWLCEKKTRHVSVSAPRKGKGMEVLRIARSNAENAFNAVRQANQPEKTINILARALGLKNQPARIECFDISNIGGRHAVGAMVTFVNGKPWKQGYRRFRVNTIEEADDYAMMYEVLKRRYGRKENLPDLMVIDGGKGHLGVAVSVLHDLELKGMDIIGIAKAKVLKNGQKTEDHVYLPGRKNPVYLSKWPSALFLLQGIRDEAHRFAVSYYRKLKEKKDFQSVLDQVPGIGQNRKKALLTYFGDIRKIRTASLDSLQKVDGIGRQTARNILTLLNEAGGEITP